MTNEIDTHPAQETEESFRTFEHVIAENDTIPNECAIFPADATDIELLTNWIVANGDGFVDLETMR